MKEKVKIVNLLGDVMFEVLMPETYQHVLTRSNKITRHIKSVKKVPIGTGNAGKDLEHEAVYDGFQARWEDFKQLAENDADV